MSFASDIEAEVKRTFRQPWTVSKATTVPDPSSIALERNDAKEIDEATVLYADLSGSTTMVDSYTREFCAEVYRSFLYASARVIRNEGGEITAYDGDRVMAVFLGNAQSSNAARTCLKINYVISQIINPAIQAQYKGTDFVLRHVVGVDFSSLFVARTGVRGDNDLVWVGRAANYAAKLTEQDRGYPSYITAAVFDRLNEESKYSSDNPRQIMWSTSYWSEMNMTIYGSHWWWSI